MALWFYSVVQNKGEGVRGLPFSPPIIFRVHVILGKIGSLLLKRGVFYL